MKLSFRILQKEWYTDEAFGNLLCSIKRNLALVDEVMFFVGTSHSGYDPLSEFEKRVSVMKTRMDVLRKIGIRSIGVNIWSSFGHVDEAWDWIDVPEFQVCVGHDGKTSTNCLCMRDERFLDYIEEKYAIVAKIEPDFIWVDDDVRFQHHQVEYPCFCHKCVSGFSKLVGENYNRERLVKELDAPGNVELRKKFLEYNRDSLNEACRRMSAGARRYNQHMRVGLMTTSLSWGSYALSDQEGMLAALDAQMIRPGGGFYNDERPVDLITKLIECSLQNVNANGLNDIEWELEDFPVCRNKSAHVHMFEITGALMTGCTDITLNSVIPYDYPDLMSALAKGRHMWDHLATVNSNTYMRGFCPIYIADADSAELSTHSIFSHDIQLCHHAEFAPAHLGMSWTPIAKDAELCAISGDMMAAIPDNELIDIFSRGVIMDAEALIILEKRGYSNLAGCKVNKSYHSGLYEKYLSHPINNTSAGIIRDVFMTFWDRDGITVYTLDTNLDAEPLTELFSITGERCGVGSCVYENHLGGRVAVCSYFPWRFTSTPGKADTFHELVNYLTKGQFPIMVSGGPHVMPILRTRNDGDGFTVMLLNTSFDSTQPLKVRLNGRSQNLYVYDTYGTLLPIKPGTTYSDGFTTISLPALSGWNALLLIGD